MGKIAVVSGGTSGVGAFLTRELAIRGFKVYFIGRNQEAGETMAKTIRHATFIKADLSLPTEMKRVCEFIHSCVSHIDVLVTSTGVLHSERVVNAAGFEMTFATQYLCRAYLTRALTDLLKKSPESRVVFVGAPILKNAKIYWDNLSLEKNYSLFRAAGQGMLASHLFVQEYAKRNPKGPAINIAHVGVTKSGIDRGLKAPLRWILKAAEIFIALPMAKAGQNFIDLATDPEFAKISGVFFPKPKILGIREEIKQDPELSSKLWNETSKWLEL